MFNINKYVYTEYNNYYVLAAECDDTVYKKEPNEPIPLRLLPDSRSLITSEALQTKRSVRFEEKDEGMCVTISS